MVDPDPSAAKRRQGLLNKALQCLFVPSMSRDPQRWLAELPVLVRHPTDPGLLSTRHNPLRPAASESWSDPRPMLRRQPVMRAGLPVRSGSALRS